MIACEDWAYLGCAWVGLGVILVGVVVGVVLARIGLHESRTD